MAEEKKKKIADFEIIEKVGQGGMGAVYRARQVAMQRIVALKVLTPKLAKNEKFKARFMREARVSAKLNHINIINGIECGEEDGVTFFAMEFVDGPTTKQLLKEKKKFPIDEAYKIVRQIAEALAYVNKHNIIHRDIKPDNIMVTSEGTAKLCDLGLAKLAQTSDEETGDEAGATSENPELTQSGQTLGTPYYIAPEQAKGKKTLDTRADIYSLGGTFYHLITGQAPFTGKSGMEIMKMHVSSEEAPSVCELQPDLHEGWGQVVSKMMAKNPEDRYASPVELIEDLDAAHEGRPVKAKAFKAKTSCALPPKNMRKASSVSMPAAKASVPTIPVKDREKEKEKAPAPKVPVSTSPGSNRKMPAAAPRAEREDTPPSVSTRPFRSANRSSAQSVGGIVGAAVAVGVVVVLMLGSSGGRPGSSTTGNQKPNPAKVPERIEPPERANPAVPAVVAEKPKFQPEAVEVVQKEVTVLKPNEQETKARETLEKTLAKEKEQPGEFKAILAGFGEALAQGQKTAAAPEIEAALKATQQRWSDAFDAAFKPMKEAAEAALKKNDFTGALKALDKTKLPDKLDVEDAAERFEREARKIRDAAEAEAAKILSAARAKAEPATIPALEVAVETLATIDSIPAELAPSVAKAAEERTAWKSKAAELKKVFQDNWHAEVEKARPVIRPIIKRLMEKREPLNATLEYLEKQRNDPAYAEIAEVVRREKEDVAAMQTLRAEAFNVLKKKIGENVKLSLAPGGAGIQAGSKPDRLTLATDKGGFEITADRLAGSDVILLVPQKEDGSDLKTRALLSVSGNDLPKARDYFQKARDAGHPDAVAFYLDWFEILDQGGEAEVAARRAWEAAEKLFEEKKFSEAKEAYTAFKMQHARTRCYNENVDRIADRLNKIGAAPLPPSAGLLGTYTAGAKQVSRVDPQIAFSWGTQPPVPELTAEAYSVTWTGQIKADKAGLYTFTVVIGGKNCSVMLTIGGKVLCNQDFSGLDRKQDRADADLAEGLHDITLQYTHTRGSGKIELHWSLKDGFAEEVVPATALSHDGKKAPKPPENVQYLSELDYTDDSVGYGKFGRSGDLGAVNRRISVKGAEAPRGLGMRPQSRGYATVTYSLGRQYKTFKTTVAIDDFCPIVGCESPITFKVIANKKVLWESQPMQRPRSPEECSIDVTGVDKLELRVECKGSSRDAYAVWIDPCVMK